jgi:O-antigen/teichoic acid export membrane protein
VPPAHPPSPPGGSLRAGAIRGSVWTLGGHVFAQLLRLVSNVILARLLFPAVFGQMALVYTFVTGLQLFSDVGTGPAIIQSPRGDDPRFLRTAWTITLVRGFVLWGAAWAIAIPMASFYGQPLLAWLIPAAGFNAVLNGLESTSPSQARRHMRVGLLTVMEITSQVVGSLTTIALALLNRHIYGPNDPTAVWAIVGGGLAQALVRLVFTYTVLPGVRPRWLIDRPSLRDLMHIGRWIFVSTLLTFLAGPADRLIFGKMIPMALLGVYGIAANLAVLPTEAILKLGYAVVFPAYARLQERGDFRKVFGRVRMPLLLLGALIVSGLIASGPFLIRVLYDRRYYDAGWILQFLAAMAWFQILEITNGAALLARGRADWVAAGNGTKLAGMVAFLPLGYHLAGFEGALAGLVLAEVLKYLVSAVGVARRGLPVFRGDVFFTIAVGVVSGLAFLAGRATDQAARSSLAGFLAAGTLVTAFWGVWGLRYWRREKSERAAWLASGGVAPG